MSRVGASQVFTATVCPKCDALITAKMTPPSNTSKVITTLLIQHGWCHCEAEAFLDLID